ncbi:UDP-galactose-4-epimerase [Lysobacter concretionis Ko07 = DSM 16239]|uniref:UDP-glucose 4-epimerase n=2 Tax=Lysobacterales TaxID=135614 RepID=A0A0A0ERU2_9GAMM|nr:UDP-galactose-4-epimerase [Lysobacter concretionis Ko07 = DSM 16239]QOD92329.1 UDP-glucose 4-epimerase GalE [Lysobacter sp. CW239]
MILVTGGTGYIGSHACVALTQAGFEVLVLDNLSNSTAGVIDRIARICGRRPAFIEGDIRNESLLAQVLGGYRVDAIMHFAGLKAVGESVEQPLQYYDNNVVGTHSLLKAMREKRVRAMVFSSSATVYSPTEPMPLSECAARRASNPYGRTKLVLEDMIEDVYAADPDTSFARLRYFNPVGAHESGLIGENPKGFPNNLMPYVCQVAAGVREKLSVFGGDYPTVDGTGVRDFIHVMDLVEGHVVALRHCLASRGLLTVNLGTGQGTSVLQLVHAFESANGCVVPHELVGRRDGDVAESWADTRLAREVLGWRTKRGIEEMCRDSWRWQLNSTQEHCT